MQHQNSANKASKSAQANHNDHEDIPTLEADSIPILGDAIPVGASSDDDLEDLENTINQLDTEVEEMILDLGYEEGQGAPDEDEFSDHDNDFSTSQQSGVAHIKNATFKDTNQIPSAPDDILNYDGDDLFVDHDERRQEREAMSSPLNPNANEDTIHSAHDPAHDNRSTESQPAENDTVQLKAPFTSPEVASLLPNIPQEDNPFLPKHLRDKLDRSKQHLLEDIARSSEAINASSGLLKNYQQKNNSGTSPAAVSNSTHQKIIDALVAQYLPIIEAELRVRLSASLHQTHEQFTHPTSNTDDK